MRATATVSNADSRCVLVRLRPSGSRVTTVGLRPAERLSPAAVWAHLMCPDARWLDQGKQAVAASGIDQVPANGIARE